MGEETCQFAHGIEELECAWEVYSFNVHTGEPERWKHRSTRQVIKQAPDEWIRFNTAKAHHAAASAASAALRAQFAFRSHSHMGPMVQQSPLHRAAAVAAIIGDRRGQQETMLPPSQSMSLAPSTSPYPPALSSSHHHHQQQLLYRSKSCPIAPNEGGYSDYKAPSYEQQMCTYNLSYYDDEQLQQQQQHTPLRDRGGLFSTHSPTIVQQQQQQKHQSPFLQRSPTTPLPSSSTTTSARRLLFESPTKAPALTTTQMQYSSASSKFVQKGTESNSGDRSALRRAVQIAFGTTRGVSECSIAAQSALSVLDDDNDNVESGSVDWSV